MSAVQTYLIQDEAFNWATLQSFSDTATSSDASIPLKLPILDPIGFDADIILQTEYVQNAF